MSAYCHYIWVHLLSTFFVVSFSNQESEWSCIWMFCILILPFFHDFDIRFLEFFRWCGIFYFHFIFILYINSKSHNRNLQHGYLDKKKFEDASNKKPYTVMMVDYNNTNTTEICFTVDVLTIINWLICCSIFI